LGFDSLFDGLVSAAKSVGKAANYVSTGGGSAAIERSIIRYGIEFESLSLSISRFKAADTLFNSEVSTLGDETAECMNLLKDAQDFVERLSYSTIRSYTMTMPKFQAPKIKVVAKTLASFDAAVTAGQGAGLGAATSIGAWALVAHLGTASTGAAIAGLSGAAANSAILAWFGGGAVAAGGFGMTVGAFAIGGLVAIPLVAFSAHKAYAEASRIDAEGAKAHSATSENNANADNLRLLTEQVVEVRDEFISRRAEFVVDAVAIRECARELASKMERSAESFALALDASSRARGAL